MINISIIIVISMWRYTYTFIHTCMLKCHKTIFRTLCKICWWFNNHPMRQQVLVVNILTHLNMLFQLAINLWPLCPLINQTGEINKNIAAHKSFFYILDFYSLDVSLVGMKVWMVRGVHELCDVFCWFSIWNSQFNSK